jgi:hypothetical protein
MVTLSPRSSPTSAASTMGSTSIRMSADKVAMSVPPFSQSPVRIALYLASAGLLPFWAPQDSPPIHG